MRRLDVLLLAGVALVQPASIAANFTANFDDGMLPGSCRVYGQAKVQATGGAGGSGVLVLTRALNDQTGSFRISDLDAGAKVYGFRLSLRARVGGGTEVPADGWSLSFGNDLPDAAWGEEGAGNGLIIAFDTFDNGGGEAPAIEVKVGGRAVAYKRAVSGELETGNDFVPVQVELSPAGALSIRYGTTGLVADIPYPPPTGVSRARFGLGARTGGSTDNHFIDELSIETILAPPPEGTPLPPSGVGRVTLAPFACCDGQVVLQATEQEPVWQVLPGSYYMYFHLPPSFDWTRGKPVYVQIVYKDYGYGALRLEYDSSQGNTLPDFYQPSETHTRSSRVGTGRLASSYHELGSPNLAGRQNGGADFRLSIAGGGVAPLSVERVVVQSQPFDDRGFRYVLSKPWLAPYSGPTRSDVGAGTLRHKVMVGYQGWFRAPNDLSDRGWVHWCRDNEMIPVNFTVDQWPDLREYASNELFRAGEILTASGQPAYVFSSATRETVRRHFQWMRQYNIDGAFLQRFVHPASSGAWGHDEWVLHHVREAANLEGRIWAIEYDVSSLNPHSPGNGGLDPYAVLERDWKWLVDVVGVLKDPQYAHEGVKPVVFIWGLPYPDRGIGREVADRIVSFLRNDPQYGGNYVIGGIPWWWRSMTDWYDHIRLYDGVLAWMPPSSSDFTADFQRLQAWQIDYFPHAWPGFSWANLQRESASTSFYASREGGRFFWDRIQQALNPGAERLFIGMFDEYDEGTAIMPMSDDPPQPPPDWGRFVTNAGRPSDWWMSLAGAARDFLLRYRGDSMPSELGLTPRSEIGPEASVGLGATNQERFLHLVDVAGGRTRAANLSGRDCRSNQGDGLDQSLLFDVDSAYAREATAGLPVSIEFEYLDETMGIEFVLQYDSVTDAQRTHAKRVTTQGTGEWRTVRYNVGDAFFGDRQPGGSDFRLQIGGNGKLYVQRVRVAKSEAVVPVIDVQPQDRSVREGESASLIVAAHGTSPVTYRWWWNGSPLSAEASTNLTLTDVTPEQAGSYYAVVFTPTGSVTSRVATVTVVPLPKVDWVAPANIVYGTPLGATELNATASVPGTFEYDPPAGTVLNAGPGQILRVRYRPIDAGESETVTKTVSLDVLPAPLTISAQDATRAYGDSNPSLTVIFDGFVNGDTAASLVSPPIVETSAVPNSPPGIYPITVRGASSPNYQVSFVPGSFTVTKATQVITFEPIQPKPLGAAQFSVKAVASSGLAPILTVVSGPASLEGDSLTLLGLGVVVVRATQPGDDNFEPAADVERRFEVVEPFRSMRLLSTGEFAFTFTGETGRRYTLEASRNLSEWTQLSTLSDPGGVLEFRDPSARDFRWRFYRVVLEAEPPSGNSP